MTSTNTIELKNVKAIVTDIEGTTSSISFVKEVLFPYAAKYLASYIEQHQQDDAVKTQLKLTANAAHLDDTDLPAIIQTLQAWIAEDKKATPLKTLQGLIWETGYRQGDFKAHMYPDATQCLKSWHADGFPLYVYSSGSVYAQKLFFGHTEDGDLLPLFQGHFDTQIGAKQTASAYENIQRALDLPAEHIVFLSDIKEELEAAKSVGFQTVWLIRDQETQDAISEQSGQTTDAHPVVSCFTDIHIQPPNA